MVVYRLSSDARLSRSRIKLLEKQSNLDDMLANLERRVEEAVVDFIDDAPTQASDLDNEKSGDISPVVLTALQQSMAKSLNRLPIEKQLAFLDIGHNSHATIISRDVQRFEMHKLGWGIIRHWADSFEL